MTKSYCGDFLPEMSDCYEDGYESPEILPQGTSITPSGTGDGEPRRLFGSDLSNKPADSQLLILEEIKKTNSSLQLVSSRIEGMDKRLKSVEDYQKVAIASTSSSADTDTDRKKRVVPTRVRNEVRNLYKTLCEDEEESFPTVPSHVLVVQAADSIKNKRRLIPDITICYLGVLATQHPKRTPEMTAYMREIIRASKQFRWPSWVIYDTNFRRLMAATGSKDWSKVDPSLYSCCFTGLAKSASWCEWCVSLEHDSHECPFSTIGTQQKRESRRPHPYAGQSGQPGLRGKALAGSSSRNQLQICLKYNRYDGDCKFGSQCRFRHACSGSVCMGDHPKTKCQSKSQQPTNRTEVVGSSDSGN